MDKKKLIIATGTLGGGGAERVFLNLANQLAEKDVEVHVLVTGSRPSESYPLSEKIIVEKIGSLQKNKALKILDKMVQFRAYFKQHRGATVISFFTDVSAYCVFLSTGLNIRNIVSERNDPNTIPRKKRMRLLRDITFRNANVCVFQTDDAKAYFPHTVQEKGHVIFNPIDSEKFPETWPIETREPIVLAVGRIVPQKNFMMLLKAWKQISERYPAYSLQIYGDKTYREGVFTKELEAYIHENGMESKVKLMGFSTNIYDVMNRATVYVSSSDFEGMSNTMLEAMAIGTPTIATDCPIGGARAIIKDGENGILTPVGDADALAKQIARVLDDQALREKLSIEGQKLRQELSIERIAEIWHGLL